MKYLLPLLVVLVACSPVVVEQGDTVTFTYTGEYQNGTIFDTNDLLHSADFPDQPPEKFEPTTLVVGQGNVISGFDNALFGMVEGETKTITVQPRDGYGTYDKEAVMTVPRQLNVEKIARVQRTIKVSNDELERLGRQVTVGVQFGSEDFKYEVIDLNENGATLYILGPAEEEITIRGMFWTSSEYNRTDDELIFTHNINDGQIVQTPTGPYNVSSNETHHLLTTILQMGDVLQGPDRVGRVTEENEGNLKLDFNHPLAGRTLIFTITVHTITKP